MLPYWKLGHTTLYQGHVLDVLPQLPAGSVQCIVTSPPYWGLRDYGLPPLEWPAVCYAPMSGLAEIEIPGCDPECEHVWGEEWTVSTGRKDVGRSDAPGGLAYVGDKYAGNKSASQGSYCQRCGGWRGSYGLEPTVEMYVAHTVAICRELRRVLRDDGTLWWNLGDASSTGKRLKDISDKQLLGIPWRVALALQADGWWLRSAIIWAKGVSFCPTYSGSCMPESVRDRPTQSYEHVFLLAKSARYFYDADAVRENHSSIDRLDGREPNFAPHQWIAGNTFGNNNRAGGDGVGYNPAGRNLRSVWTINPGNFPGSHFATFPPALVEPMIKAGTSAKGCCPECGAAWERVTERKSDFSDPKAGQQRIDATGGVITGGIAKSGLHAEPGDVTYTTTGWRPTCTCDAGEPVPSTVLDPFCGAGTTLLVARQLGRKGTGIELSKDYCDEHIIPRLNEPLFAWAEEEEARVETEPEQLTLDV